MSTTTTAPRSSARRRSQRLPAICHCLWSLGALIAGSTALAQDGRFDEDALYRLHEQTRPAAVDYELRSATVPALDGAALAAGRPGTATGYAATQSIDVTRWLTPQAQHRFGLSLGMSAPALPPAAPAVAPLAGSAPPLASLDLGVRWRSRLDSGRHLDVSAWARAPQAGVPSDALGMVWQARQPAFGTRVEVQWASSRTRGLVPEFGAVGVQLQGNSRLLLRARKGGPMLYYRAKF